MTSFPLTFGFALRIFNSSESGFLSKKMRFKVIVLLIVTTPLFLAGCISTVRKPETVLGRPVKVNQPNASYFDVKTRIELIKTTTDPILVAAAKRFQTYHGAEIPTPEPVDDYRVARVTCEDRRSYQEDTEPLTAFERAITELAALYVSTDDLSYAKGLLRVLRAWADKDALLSFEYNGNHEQAWYAVDWAASAAGFAYSIIRGNPGLNKDTKLKVEKWLNEVARKQISYPGDHTPCWNNHVYWRGLEAAIVGAVSDDDYLFGYGIEQYRSALASMNTDGSLPLEMEKGSRAIRSQNLALLPLVYIAEVASRQGYNLYDVTIDGKDIHGAVGFLIAAIKDNHLVKKYSGEKQDMSFLSKDDHDEKNWMEPYYRRFKNNDLKAFLRTRPFYHSTYGGGPSTLYFYEPPSPSK
jgi:poly(beta-D-mannuronate) lyase